MTESTNSGTTINTKGSSGSGSSSNEEEELKYHHGFGNHFESEAHPNALPIGRNNPRLVPHGLYAEQLSGTAFTAPREENRRTWLYRTRPSANGTSHRFYPCGSSGSGSDAADSYMSGVLSSLPEIFGGADWTSDMKLDPNPMRWGATPLSSDNHDNAAAHEERSGINFLQGVRTLLGSGDPTCKAGIGIYVYACNADMSSNNDDGEGEGGKQTRMHLYNSDGDFLIVPQQRTLAIQTEMGKMIVAPGEICVVPRGVVFTVNIAPSVRDSNGDNGEELFARGYMLEIFRGHFQLPELGPIGSNGLANARDFRHPVAYYDSISSSDNNANNKTCIIVNKFGQTLFARSNPHSPYNVVAWHGNYLPYKYDLRNFCAMNSVTYDHPDPSIYTVLTAKGGDEEGTALADFVIFPPRVMATGEIVFS